VLGEFAKALLLTMLLAVCYNTICAGLGGVSERFMELVLKTSDPARDRGFESHPLRHLLTAAGHKDNRFDNIFSYGVVLKRLKRMVC
jgi:hypothetical protein